ncbi:kinesin-like protein KIN-UC, partial [Tanacetum coccineum]
KLHLPLTEQGGIRELLGMVRSGNNDAIAQVARGLANFTKCESRAITQEDNTRDFVTSGVKQLAKISVESNRDDIRNLAKKILGLNQSFKVEVQLE